MTRRISMLSRSALVLFIMASPCLSLAATQEFVIGNFSGTLTYGLADPSRPGLTNVTISANDMTYPLTVNLDDWLKFPGVTLLSADFRVNMSGVDLERLAQDLTPLVNAGLDAAQRYLNGESPEALIPAVLTAAQPLLGAVTQAEVEAVLSDPQLATLLSGAPAQPSVNTIVNPEPSTWLLLATGLIGVLAWRQKAGVEHALARWQLRRRG